MADEYENLPDTQLAQSAAGGDETAFAEIVRRHSPRVFRTAGRFFRRYSLVEEAAQEVFLKAFTQLKNFEGRGSLEGWLTRITVNTCINILRSAKNQPELSVADLTDDEAAWLENTSSASANFHDEEQKLIAADLLDRVLRSVPPEDSFVLQMIDGEGASIKETAALTGWSESKVKVKTFRARRRVREVLQKLVSGRGEKISEIRHTAK